MLNPQKLFDLSGKTAIVTGGAEGIGFGIASALAGQGMNIVLTDINGDQLEQARQELAGRGNDCISAVRCGCRICFRHFERRIAQATRQQR